MYESFFGFAQRPFPTAPRAELYYPAAAIEEARQNLTRSVQRAEGPGLVIGSTGSGKSLLCSVLAEQFRDTLEIVHLASARLCSRRALLQAILYELGLPYRDKEEGELRLSLIDHLAQDSNDCEATLMLVDEAHSLPLTLLEEIRMVTNLVRNGQSGVRLVLAGSPALEERFAHPKLDSFNQRVAVRCYLDAFDSQDTSQYVRAQLDVCGVDPATIFDDDAIQTVFQATEGNPRLINQLCDHALVLAFGGGVKPINSRGVEEAWADLQQLPMPFTDEAPSVDYQEPNHPEDSAIEFGSLDSTDEALEPAAELEEASRSLPFPADMMSEVQEPEELTAQVESIEEQISDIDEDFQPIGTIGPEVELMFHEAHNPFAESFDDEEVVIDRFASLEEDVLRDRPRVANRAGDSISELLHQSSYSEPTDLSVAPAGEAHEAFELSQTPTSEFDQMLPDPVMPDPNYVDQPVVSSHQENYSSEVTGDEDIIVVEDDPAPPKSRPAVRRQEYCQLFANLRHG